ncbi:unnamed protein product [Psylliodes chrysocephalus]|uniref:26S proteasome non-ATPase regulatory subunit 6 n=1 Tax=Psylliodes chrysocephalus TaxID=3402493 RepID=A0A9P0CRV9_9CUCU|nr:unnamed protein product [Psylliodes chrysocephala]
MACEIPGSEEPPKCPTLDIAQLKFALSLPEYSYDYCRKHKLLTMILAEDMAPYYKLVTKDLDWEFDVCMYYQMKQHNDSVLEEIDKEIEDSLKDMGLTEMRELYMKKANYLSKIGDKENTIKALSQAYDSTIALKNKLDNIFYCIRIGLFFMDTGLIRRNIQRAESMLEQGADWHSRNCFKIYKALYSLITRDFKTAANLLVNSISTFICTEVLSFDMFIRYTLLSAILTLNRSELKSKLIQNPDMQQALHNVVTLKEYLFSLYNCDYKLFFLRLADVEVLIKQDMLLNPHYQNYIREMKIKAYDQLLSTYISVNISYMSHQFGVSEDYIEDELSKLIAAGRLNYKIDKISGKVVNEHSESKMEVFKAVIKQGDIVLNRIHKLSRVINI